jgi:hypothetical protein
MNFLFYISDFFIFIFIQTLLLFCAAISYFADKGVLSKNGSVRAQVIRGKQSLLKFEFAWGILSFVIVELINISNAFAGYKLIFAALDVSLLFYLCFFNGWFRNKVIYLYSISLKSET